MDRAFIKISQVLFFTITFSLFAAQGHAQFRFENPQFSFGKSIFENTLSEPHLSSVSSDDTDGDTSNTMSKLYEINDFMEWYMTYFPVPYGSYSQETDFLFGLSKYNAFTIRKGDTTDHITQPSSVSLFGYITLNDQYKIVLESNLMFNKNKALWKTGLIYVNYPLLFFGVGNNTNIDNARTLNTSDFQFHTEYLIRFHKMWFVGPMYDYYNYYDVSLANGSEPRPNDSINLAHNIGHQSGLGAKLLMEGRDNRLNAKHGYYLETSFQFFDKALGSEYKYTQFLADFRHYITPWKKLTIATQLKTEAKTGDVPVQSLAFVGGDYSMRGIYRGRYRDNVSIDWQSELRFPIYWIIGGTAFAGLGQVAPAYGQLQGDQFHFAYGAGLRLQVDSQHDVNLRFDIAFSNDETIFIMNFAEAF